MLSGSFDRQFKQVSYICVGCRKKRSVIVDPDLHLDREELKINGLAPYIDVHENIYADKGEEHGVKLYIDAHFHVRSNTLLTKQKAKQEKVKPGALGALGAMPAPIVSLQSKKLLYPSKSWNSLEISSKQHNIGYFIVNTDPSITDEDKMTESIESTLGTVTATISFYRAHLTSTELQNSKIWVEVMVDWIESTPSLNAAILPSILRYIDSHTDSPPNVVDQLSIPILLDKSAKIQLKDNRQLLDEIIGTTIQNPFNMGVFYPDKSVDYEILFLIKDRLSKRGFTNMNWIIEGMKEEATSIDKALDAFVLFFFELVEKDSIEYKVSYLL